MTDIIERTELLLSGPADALGSLLDVSVPDLARGAGLPLLWHWLYLLERPAQADLGPDGHPICGTVPAPPELGKRRMWAGGRVRTHGALRCREEATRRTQVLSVQHKDSRSGPLTFVTVGHQILQNGHVVIDEQQDVVYREATQRSKVPKPVLNGPVIRPAEREWAIETSSTVLFRFSALTYNGHRIHYDRDYARDVEGYAGLVTHGPLQALAMAEVARAQGCSGDQFFEYRLVSPLFDFQGLVARAVRNGSSTTTVVRDLSGRQTAKGTLHHAP